MKRVIWFVILIVTFLIVIFLVGCKKKGTVPSSGRLDITFGYNGKVTKESVTACAAVLQSDGKIITAGGAYNNFALSRFNTDGSLDANFGIGGTVTTDFGASHAELSSVALQTDGKIVSAGTSSGDFALVRHNTDGNLDTTFGINGKVTTDFGTSSDHAYAVAIQADGKIVSVGSGFNLVRYNSDGSLDVSFGTDGRVFTNANSSANAAIIQADGKIVAAGSSSGDFALGRYNTDGSLDVSFGTNGMVFTTIGTFSSMINAVAIGADGKIVAAGSTYTSGSSYNAANSRAARTLFTIGPGHNYFALARYNTDGSLDASFGSSGIVTTSITLNYNFAYAVAIQLDGQIVAAGVSFTYPSEYPSFGPDFVLVRYKTNGSLDTNFGTKGKATTDFSNGPDAAYAIVIQTDGKIVAAGVSTTSNGDVTALARYLP